MPDDSTTPDVRRPTLKEVRTIRRKYLPIIGMDFDGVIHSYASGWCGLRLVPDPPVDGILMWMHRALNSGFRVAVYSSRGRYWGGRRAMRIWLRTHALAEHLWHEQMDVGLEEVEFPRHKPPALVTLDDRALTFNGTLPRLEELRSFEPWTVTRDSTCKPRR